MAEPRIRPYQPADREAVGRICILTGDSGQDATGKYFDDQILPVIYAYPYVDHSPDLAWVVEDDGEVIGYILGVADVEPFVGWWREHWTPQVEAMFPERDDWSAGDRRLVRLGLEPEQQIAPWREEHPAEFHIDMLPAAQGKGLGRKLIDVFLAELHRRGVASVGIGVGARNENAVGFYKRLGFDVYKETRDAEGKVNGYLMTIPTAPAGEEAGQ